ncbi:hypothetical protein ARC78_03750 [Stenotrophomonas pictorum JCM 9942]|uniref:Uncharacterized protein n=2 Tax=Stenotrophomonas pictorum TaxID=86184 RepID=A0A0R0AIC7_9GAMM|nr:hypothetical protein [Stenotrophomonas pictorum]KRG44934.1 hypothetical protein ARC78_03750 [Stenotrophomonas pictorum JCM 9942]
MKPAAKIVLGAGALALVGVLLVAGLQRQPSAAVAPAQSAVETVSSGLPPAATATQDTVAPWQSSGAAQTATPDTGIATAPAFPRRPAKPAAATQLSLQQMDQQLAQNEAQAQALLRQLDTAAATGSLPANVNIEAARANIQIALQAQRLGREMAMLIQQPDSPQRQARISQVSDELGRLRAQLRYDISSAASAAPAPAAPR